jgi:hypothetical protein
MRTPGRALGRWTERRQQARGSGAAETKQGAAVVTRRGDGVFLGFQKQRAFGRLAVV